VIDRLRRNSGHELDTDIVKAAFIYDDAKRAAFEDIYRQYLDIGSQYDLPLLLSTATWRASQKRIASAGYAGTDVNGDNFRFLDALRKEYGGYARRTRQQRHPGRGGAGGIRPNRCRPESRSRHEDTRGLLWDKRPAHPCAGGAACGNSTRLKWQPNPRIKNPELLNERGRGIKKETKSFDKVFFGLMFPLNLAQVVVAGLDAGRFGWTHLPAWANGLGTIVIDLGSYSIPLINRDKRSNLRDSFIRKIKPILVRRKTNQSPGTHLV